MEARQAELSAYMEEETGAPPALSSQFNCMLRDILDKEEWQEMLTGDKCLPRSRC